MNTYAKQEQLIFWNIFDDILIQNGEPFELLHEKSGEVTFWGVVNKKKSLIDLGLSVDFSVQKETLRINIYMRNKIDLYEYLYERKDEIEQKLGFNVIWNDKCPHSNTRRIEYNISFVSGDRNGYMDLIEEALPIIASFKEVFTGYIENLVDF